MRTGPRVPNPWLKFKPSVCNVLSGDAPFVLEFNKYVERRKLKKEIAIDASLLPEPFFGRFDAPIVLLLKNPGLDKHGKDLMWHLDPEFKKSLTKALTNPRGQEHFHLLDPTAGPGCNWWRKACKPLNESLANNTPRLASKLLAIEYFPYHSRSFAHATPRLPSQTFTFQLVRDAIKRGAQIVCMRGELEWIGAVPELRKYRKFCVAEDQQNSVVSRSNVLSFGVLLRILRKR
jgi:hypothetical protein